MSSPHSCMRSRTGWFIARVRCVRRRRWPEYEAEAVEALVTESLGLGLGCAGSHAVLNSSQPTDNLLFDSVLRVRSASSQICRVLCADRSALQPQAPIDIQTAPGEKVVFEYELYGMGDFFGLPEAF